jgi:hypothetical protein
MPAIRGMFIPGNALTDGMFAVLFSTTPLSASVNIRSVNAFNAFSSGFNRDR